MKLTPEEMAVIGKLPAGGKRIPHGEVLARVEQTGLDKRDARRILRRLKEAGLVDVSMGNVRATAAGMQAVMETLDLRWAEGEQRMNQIGQNGNEGLHYGADPSVDLTEGGSCD